MEVIELKTDRLILRQWKDQDLPFFAKLNSDSEVMEYFPGPLSNEESDTLANKCKSLISERGWGLWATEVKETGEFIGFVGIHQPKGTLPFAPCVEIGWRLSKKHWGRGYATEAAAQVLGFSFDVLGLDEVISFTTASNYRSRAVMERLGFANTGQDFKHPDIPVGHLLSEHVLYKITKSGWQLTPQKMP